MPSEPKPGTPLPKLQAGLTGNEASFCNIIYEYNGEDIIGFGRVPNEYRDAVIHACNTLAELQSGIDTLSQRCGFPIVENLPQVLVTIGNKVERLDKELAELQKPCVWTYDDEHDKWDTACGEAFQVMSDGPTENAMRFCPFCAHPIPASHPITESENDHEEV